MNPKLLLALAAVMACAATCAAVPIASSTGLQVQFKFDEATGAKQFADASTFKRHAKCSLVGASCPTSGIAGKYSNSAHFAKHCSRTAYQVDGRGNPSNRGNTIREGADCGSRLDFNPVHFTDGTVMLWYQEDGHSSVVAERMPMLENGRLAPSDPKSDDYVKWRRSVGNGWDLSLIGGNGLSLGRISADYWGGYWCGQWHVAKADRSARGGQSPQTRSADPMAGWDHLEWHHLAFVFSSSTVMVYVDGVRVVVFRNTGVCQKSASFLGLRTVRYNAQNGVRETEQTGLTGARPRQSDGTTGALNHQLEHLSWSRNFFKGKMDDVRIFSKVLSESQIASAKNGNTV